MAITIEQLDRKVSLLQEAVTLLQKELADTRAEAKAAEKIGLVALDKASVVQVAASYAPPTYQEPWEQPKPKKLKPFIPEEEAEEGLEDEPAVDAAEVDKETQAHFAKMDAAIDDDDGYDPSLDTPILSGFKNPAPKAREPKRVTIGGQDGRSISVAAEAAFRNELFEEAIGEDL